MKQPPSIPAHYRPLGEKEIIRKGDWYYCILDAAPKIYRIKHTRTGLVNCTPNQWLDYRFFRRRHIVTRPQTPTRIALNDSVRHWNRLATGKSMVNESTGHNDCALCHMFYKENTCNGCPISNFTGFNHCGASPYKSLTSFNGDKNNPKFKAAATKFRDWLKQLPIEDEENV